MSSSLLAVLTIVAFIFSALALMAVLFRWVSERDIAVKNIESRLERFIDAKLQELAIKSSSIRPDLGLYLTSQWRFVEKIFHYRFEKSLIAKKLVMSHIADGTSLLLDSGSTTDLITSELLLQKKPNVQVHSNNVFAAMHLVGTSLVTFRLLPGLFNEKFAAVYSEDADRQIEHLPVNLYVLAAVRFSSLDGLMVAVDDEENQRFKSCALRAFSRNKASRLVVAVDASKFVEDRSGYVGAVPQAEWQAILRRESRRIAIVTNPAPRTFTDQQRLAFEREVSLFEGAGIVVDAHSIGT